MSLFCFPVGNAQDHKIVSTLADTSRVIALQKQSNILRDRSAIDSALILLKEALQISRTMGYDEGMAGTLMCIAFCYQDKGNYNKSKEMLYKAFPYCLSPRIKRDRILLAFYNGMGANFALAGNNDSAIHFFYEALNAVKKLSTPDSFMLQQIYNNLGTAWMKNTDFDKALHYQFKAKILAIRLKDSFMLGKVSCNIGASYLYSGDTALAIKYLEASERIHMQTQNLRGLQIIYSMMGNAQQSPVKAIAYFEKAIKIDTLSAFTADIYQGLGKSYYLLGDYGKAKTFLLKSQDICVQNDLLSQRLQNYHTLSSVYERLGILDTALKYQVAYANLNDSLLNTEKIKAVNGLDIKYQSAEKDKILAQNRVALYRQRQWIFGFAAGGLLLSLSIGAMYRNHRYKQNLQRVHIRNMEQQQKIAQLHAKMQGEEEERSRIARELHDGVNVLLSATKINYAVLGKEHGQLPKTQTYQEGMNLLNEMSLELRTITYKLVPQLLIQQSLPDAVETFCEIIKKGNALCIEVQAYGSFSSLSPEFCFTIYRIVQELTHNIVKHAEATSALIQLHLQDEFLNLTVEDNGKGFNTNRQGIGMGIKSIRSRVEDLKGQIKFNSELGVGTSVDIEIAVMRP